MDEPESASVDRVAELFLRGLGGIYLCAFVSLGVQVVGLVGAQGIAPAAELLAFARDRLGGPGAVFALPTLLWITGASDWMLLGMCALGIAAALSLVLGRARLIAAFIAWASYLSLSCVGDVFLSFQWDALLLESGVVAWFAASREPRLGVWLARALLFKLMILSGAVKLASGDPTWRDLTALTYHYWTQPLPWEASFFAAQLPDGVQKLSAFLVFVVELGAPWGMFGPRRMRFASAALLVSLQLLIAATGNYGFFNLLTLLLCATLVDDRRLAQRAWLARPPRPPRWVVARRVGAGALLCASAVVGLERLVPRVAFPRPVRAAIALIEPLRSVSAYGLFAVMTTERPEIQIEGSADGQEWRSYVFRWKPGALDRRPGFAGPHMPRLDWQMWFAALSSCRDEAWFQSFLVRLLEGSPAVLPLLDGNPFPDAPPRFVRTTLFHYRFASLAEWRAGAWWTREEFGPYCPTVELRDGHLSLAEP